MRKARPRARQVPDVAAVQIMLDRARHSPGVIHGVMGWNTRRAIVAYQKQVGLEPSGEITPTLVAHLKQAHGRTVMRGLKSRAFACA